MHLRAGSWALAVLGLAGVATAFVPTFPARLSPVRSAWTTATVAAGSAFEDWGDKISTSLERLDELANQIVVIKYGGHAMGSSESRASFARDLALLQAASIKCIVVHGGGPEIKKMLEKLEIPTRFEDGLRVTDQATVEVAEMVLSGTINKRTVDEICKAGGSAVGLSGKDCGLIEAEQVSASLGLVGEPVFVNVELLEALMESGIMPVIAPIGVGVEDGLTYNINADTAAGAIAEAVGAQRLLLLTDVQGVLSKEGELFEELTPQEVEELTEDGTISGGMVPKLETAVDAVMGGVEGAVILDGRNPHAVLVDLLGDAPTGTEVREEPEDEDADEDEEDP